MTNRSFVVRRRSVSESELAVSARTGFAVVPMSAQHLSDVMRIETSVYPDAWSETYFLSELTAPSTKCYLVALHGHAVVGYGGVCVFDQDAHVTNIAVDPTWQNNKVGTQLLLHLSRFAAARAKDMTLEVRLSNLGAQRLYAKFGFVPAGIRKNYYQRENEDALIMWANDVDSVDYNKRLVQIENSLSGQEAGGQ